MQAIVIAQDRGDDDGTNEAFAQLLSRHIDKMHHFVLRITNQPGDADDLVQETFLRAWRNAHRFSEQRASVATWLFSIARNLCIDQHRRYSARPVGHSVDDGQAMIEDGLIDASVSMRADASQNLNNSRRLDSLRAAIAELPERQRTAITLCQLQGHSNAYAAELLDVKVSAVESLLARARRTLKKVLGDIDRAATPQSQVEQL